MKINLINLTFYYLLGVGSIIVLLLVVRRYFYVTNQVKLLPDFPLVATIILIGLFPLFRMGKVNDFLVRSLMPLFLVAGYYVLLPYTKKSSNNLGIMHNLIFAVAVIGTAPTLGHLLLAGRDNKITAYFLSERTDFRAIPYNSYESIYALLLAKWSNEEANQYLGKAESYYERYLAPNPEIKKASIKTLPKQTTLRVVE